MKEKRKKLDPIPKINRRLFKLWSEAVRGRVNFKCEICGMERGTLNDKGRPVKMDAHHFMNRDITDCPLKFDIRNGICLCPKHHKFSPDESFHMNPVVTMDWVIKNRPDSFNFVLNNYKTRVDLHNREILAEIESSLEKKEPLNLEKLIEIDNRYKQQEKTLFDNL